MDDNQMLNKELLEKLYLRKHMTCEKIAKEYFGGAITKQTVYNHLKKYNIQIRHHPSWKYDKIIYEKGLQP